MSQPHSPTPAPAANPLKQRIEASVREVVADLTESRPGDIRPQDHLVDDLGLDSLQEMELVSRLSEEYDVDPDLDDLVDIETVTDVVVFVSRYVRAGAQPEAGRS